MVPASWRFRTEHDAPLEDIYTSLGRRPGSQRCGMVGLYRGDCQEPRLHADWVCYYHAKLRDGLITPADEHHGVLGPVGTSAYPVWPIPPRPFVLLGAQEGVA